MRCAGILLTGGASTRFGQDKATTRFEGSTLAERAGSALRTATEPAIEVGPGVSGLPAVDDARQGPLVALAAGLAALPESRPGPAAGVRPPPDRRGAAAMAGASTRRWAASFLWLAIPRSPSRCAPGGRLAALATVPGLVEAGERSLRPLLAGSDVTFIAPPTGRRWPARLRRSTMPTPRTTSNGCGHVSDEAGP